MKILAFVAILLSASSLAASSPCPGTYQGICVRGERSVSATITFTAEIQAAVHLAMDTTEQEDGSIRVAMKYTLSGSKDAGIYEETFLVKGEGVKFYYANKSIEYDAPKTTLVVRGVDSDLFFAKAEK